MEGVGLGLIGFLALFVLMAIRVPIGLAMLLVGAIGSAGIIGIGPFLNSLKTQPYEYFSNYSLSIIPMFLLMGQFASQAGMSAALFRAARSWLGHKRGGVAMAIGACGAFGAVSGSSLATAGTMAQVALPEMKRAGYAGGIATGTLAAGGTLGILIPPSIVLVVYAILAGQNIAKLFAAALVPGILAMLSYMAAVSLYVRLFPESAPVVPKAPARERLTSLQAVGPVLFIFALVIGGIYVGIFTPTEGAAVGAVATFVLAVLRRSMSWKGFADSVFGMATGTGMIFFIVLGASLFNNFLALTYLPQTGAAWVAGLEVSPWLIIIAILACYVVLGCVMDSLSMILLTIPIFFPIVVSLDFGLTPEETALWFGILALIVVEMGLITPPVGLNLFIINSMAPGVRMSETIRGVLPFLAADLVRVAVLVAFPIITLALVRLID